MFDAIALMVSARVKRRRRGRSQNNLVRADGSIDIPAALRPYMGDLECLTPSLRP